MKILFLTNNENSVDLYEWIKKEENGSCILFSKKITIDIIQSIQPDMIISYNYRYLIKREIIEAMNARVFNLHISFLPWNRGSNPNFWSFFENTPKGVTIHRVDVGLDTGNILWQKEIPFDVQKETFISSYEKLNFEIKELFKEKWNDLKSGNYIEKKQADEGSYHNMEQFQKITNKYPLKWTMNIQEYLNSIERY